MNGANYLWPLLQSVLIKNKHRSSSVQPPSVSLLHAAIHKVLKHHQCNSRHENLITKTSIPHSKLITLKTCATLDPVEVTTNDCGRGGHDSSLTRAIS